MMRCMSGGKAGDGVGRGGGTGDSSRHASQLQKLNQEAKKLAALKGDIDVVFRKIQAAYEEQFRNQDAKQLAALEGDIDVVFRKMQAAYVEQFRNQDAKQLAAAKRGIDVVLWKMQADNKDQINIAREDASDEPSFGLFGLFVLFVLFGLFVLIVIMYILDRDEKHHEKSIKRREESIADHKTCRASGCKGAWRPLDVFTRKKNI